MSSNDIDWIEVASSETLGLNCAFCDVTLNKYFFVLLFSFFHTFLLRSRCLIAEKCNVRHTYCIVSK